jgi:hypothetical protein
MLWYEQHPANDTGVFGWMKAPTAHCDSILWHVGNTSKPGAKWCRSTSPVCSKPPTPAPPSPPTPPSSWRLYAVPETAVTFKTQDTVLASMFSKGEALAAGNIKSFRKAAGGVVEVMVEGAEYRSAWIETQPMAGAMYAHRNVRVALNNQLVFMRSARSDGFMAHRVDANPNGYGACFSKEIYARECLLRFPRLLA